MARKRLHAGERREAILNGVAKVCAEKGFRAATTRELAQSAGVSEALLFKHFPNKQALYSALMACAGEERTWGDLRRAMSLPPSTATLVVLLHHFVTAMIAKGAQGRSAAMGRLIMHSAMEDAVFARHFLRDVVAGFITKLEECMKAAVAAGDIAGEHVPLRLRGWLAHHATATLSANLAPREPLVDYGMGPAELVEPVVWFLLRGIGLREQAIRKHYPKALSNLAS